MRRLPDVTICDDCHLPYYQTSVPHVCAGGAVDDKRFLLAERERYHRLLVAVKALRLRHRQRAKKANFNDCGCDDCLFLQPVVDSVESAALNEQERTVSEDD